MKSSAKKTIDDNIDFLMEELEKINPTTAYDVEEEALSLIHILPDRQRFLPGPFPYQVQKLRNQNKTGPSAD